MNKDYYAVYYQMERSHWWFKVREKILISQIKRYIAPKANLPLKILNVGVATGRTTEFLTQFGEVISLEYDLECCQFLREKLQMEVVQGSVLDLPFADNQFDLVCAFDVIEHVEDDKRAVEELYRVCKPESHIFLTVPAFMELWSSHDIVNQHYRRYRLPEVKGLFSRLKGKIIFNSYFNSILFPPIYIYRKLASIFKSLQSTPSSDFENVAQSFFMSRILHSLFSMEVQLLKKISFSFGVSLGYIYKKI
jgi:ubiquinone/menaquinone biosynthesis C-methylase UbiE